MEFWIIASESFVAFVALVAFAWWSTSEPKRKIEVIEPKETPLDATSGEVWVPSVYIPDLPTGYSNDFTITVTSAPPEEIPVEMKESPEPQKPKRKPRKKSKKSDT